MRPSPKEPAPDVPILENCRSRLMAFGKIELTEPRWVECLQNFPLFVFVWNHRHETHCAFDNGGSVGGKKLPSSRSPSPACRRWSVVTFQGMKSALAETTRCDHVLTLKHIGQVHPSLTVLHQVPHQLHSSAQSYGACQDIPCGCSVESLGNLCRSVRRVATVLHSGRWQPRDWLVCGRTRMNAINSSQRAYLVRVKVIHYCG